ncbi:peptide chain release factor-like protein [Phanerochaete sordida]|uniref:Peptide chain release factor-like protein n=1 Tax=Phanerochaete sordida TaxID=48140 RepID=A0A9P3GNF8_9APHY|nr:peptide chain release factor-like protein [Phanerochaete sordida]
MSISPALRASARAAYRDFLRASNVTFAGDVVVQNAFRLKVRNEILPAASIADQAIWEEKIALTREISEVLRRNIVQARKVEDASEEKWQLRITEHTELGDNDSIKSAKPIEPTRRKRVNDSESDSNDTPSSTPSTSSVPRFYSQLKKVAKERKIPELREEDLEETFVRGSGPGGQSVNKTENNVQLVHKPTGIRVVCQETRSLTQNRKIARRILLDKLDQMENPGLSKQEMLRAKQQERERRRKKKARKKAKARAAKEGREEEENERDDDSSLDEPVDGDEHPPPSSSSSTEQAQRTHYRDWMVI